MGLKRIFNEWREKADGTLTGPALETESLLANTEESSFFRDEFDVSPLTKPRSKLKATPTNTGEKAEIVPQTLPQWDIVSGNPSIHNGELYVPAGDSTPQIIEIDSSAGVGNFWFDGASGNAGNGGDTFIYPIYQDSDNWLRLAYNSFNDIRVDEKVNGTVTKIPGSPGATGPANGIRVESDSTVKLFSANGVNPFEYGSEVGSATTSIDLSTNKFRFEHTQGNTLRIPIMEGYPNGN